MARPKREPRLTQEQQKLKKLDERDALKDKGQEILEDIDTLIEQVGNLNRRR